MTDWTACIKTRIVKNVSKDVNFIKSTKEKFPGSLAGSGKSPYHINLLRTHRPRKV